MSLTTARKILTTYNILDKSKDNKRHPKHEFQAYAYRLAHDLNDLEHLQIYLRLCKNVERSLMERAYAFVSDSRSNEKGRLFLWKLKKIRTEIQKRRDFENYDYDFVMSKMKSIRNILGKSIREKADSEFNDTLKKMFHETLDSLNPNCKVLVLGNSSKKLTDFLLERKLKVTAIEISPELNKLMKSLFEKIPASKYKAIVKDFMKNTFESKVFDSVIVNNFWSTIPLDHELKYLKEIKRVIKKDGIIILSSKHMLRDSQEWKDYIYKKEELSYFTKSNTIKSLRETSEKLDLKVKSTNEVDGCVYFILTN